MSITYSALEASTFAMENSAHNTETSKQSPPDGYYSSEDYSDPEDKSFMNSFIEKSPHAKEWKELTDRVHRYWLEIQDEADDYYQKDAFFDMCNKYVRIRHAFEALPSVDSANGAKSKEALRDLIKKLKGNEQERMRDFVYMMDKEDKAIIDAAEKLLCK